MKSAYANPGWYPDPAEGGVRFWNGRSWSLRSREMGLLDAGRDGSLVLHGTADPDYSYRSLARLSKRGQDMTWPATAQKF